MISLLSSTSVEVLDQFLCRQALFLADFGIRKSRSRFTPPGATARPSAATAKISVAFTACIVFPRPLRCSARSTLKSYCRVLTIYPHGVYYANAVGRYIRAVDPLWTLGKTRHKSTGVLFPRQQGGTESVEVLQEFCRNGRIKAEGVRTEGRTRYGRYL